MGVLVDALEHAYRVLGFERAARKDEVFKQLVLARIIEPTSKLDSLRVLAEAGIEAPSYATLKRRMRVYAGLPAKGLPPVTGGEVLDHDAPDGAVVDEPLVVDPAGGPWREQIAKACAQHVGLRPAMLCLYDVTTLHFETHEGDGFRESGFSKERRLEPQITLGLLTDASGFPLMVHAFEGNRGETTTMIPVLQAFMAAHRLTDIVIVADAGMISEKNWRAIEALGWSFVLGARMTEVPYVVKAWREQHSGVEIPDGHVFTQPWPASPSDKRRDHTYYYAYSAARAKRTLHGIDEQVRKAEQAVAGKTAVKRNRFVKLTGAKKAVNRDLEAKARALAGIKSYVTNLDEPTPEHVIATYSALLNVEKSFRMSKSDLAARPVFHHVRHSIEAHLTIVFAALAISRWIENTTGWSIKRFVKTARRHREVTIAAGGQTITAADPLPDDLQKAVDLIHRTH
ncbi:IS1634 family transposase [Myceligenerans salitolerans]|uniref:IS1634 family transposase n=1 Tax=Myceligenerans salitolerans TaxID=1230528 RepID=A0ABS3I9X4_9MICO|nr:IS1634 family transposase [Myceligenerans salitolerans]